MNALHPPPAPPSAGLNLWPDAGRTLRLIRRLAGCLVAIAAVLLLGTFSAVPLAIEARSSGLAGVADGAILLPLTGLLATLPMAWARWRVGQHPSQAPPPLARPRWRLPGFIRPRGYGAAERLAQAAERLAQMARRPQGVIVPALSLLAALCAWCLRPAPPGLATHAMPLGGAAVVLAFPLLVAERIVAGTPRTRLPEAAALQALLFVPVLVIPLAGLVQIAAGLGFAWAPAAMTLLAAYLCLVAAELAVRSLANWFLPPPPSEAHAALSSVAALLLQPARLAPNGLATPLRTHLGLDLSRSWALRYARAAALPVATVLALVAWGLTGATLIDLDQRGIYERFGAPVAVWAPGAHLGLPWPFGRVRRLEYGVVHALPLEGEDIPAARTGAEGDAPASADRLWESAHPAEVSYLIASLETAGGQSFQVVSVDLKLLYRVGLDDASALRAAYAVAAPGALVRAEAGRLLARVFAGRVLNDMLGAGRETLAETLRARLQSELDQLGSGVELVGVVIEAIHPPVGAAEAYHNVQAAEIVADTAVATERGRAQVAAATARQTSTDLVAGAGGAAAERVGQANAALRTFTADQGAAQAGGQAFLMERYFANLATALARSPLVIVDHRLKGADAPVIDLRSFGASAGRPADDD